MEVLVFLAAVIGIAITAAIAVVSGVLSPLFGVIAEEDGEEQFEYGIYQIRLTLECIDYFSRVSLILFPIYLIINYNHIIFFDYCLTTWNQTLIPSSYHGN